MAKLFGDEKDVAIFQEDIHLDSTTQKVYGGHDADHTWVGVTGNDYRKPKGGG